MTAIPRGRHIVEFLASRPEFVGVGKATAARLWERYGSDLYVILGDGDVDRLSELLDRNQAAIVIEAWRNQQALADCVVFFDEHGIDIGLSRKAVDFWGDQAVLKMRDNPYRLLTVCTWSQVDRVATALDMRKDDPRRLVAAVESVLYDRLDRKHTWCDEAVLVELVAKRLSTSTESASAAVRLAVADGAAIPIEGGFQPAGAAYMERFIEARIEGHLRRTSRDLFLDDISPADISAFLERFDPSRNLTDEQRHAVAMAMQHAFSLLIGGAGVGKTTALRAINAAARHFGMNVYQLAIAGRAAGRIAETTGQPAQTVASWLKEVTDGRIELGRHTLVIVDEASMLDLPTLYRILFHLPEDARCLLVGDTAQLPPIGFGLTLHRLVLEDRIAKTELTRILRASAESGIPEVSLAIRQGRVPQVPTYNSECGGCSFAATPEASIVETIEDILHDLGHEEVQVVAAVYAGAAGIDAINAYFHDLRKRAGFSAMHGFAEGDPCIWTVNDYDRHLWNGSMGTVVGFDRDAVVAAFDGNSHRIEPGEIQKLSLAYCISVHKAQGSQFKNVVMPVLPTANMDRAMIYTAVTRAIDRVVLVGSEVGFGRGVRPHPRSLDREVALGLRAAEMATD
ncbi:ATP-dependent RecD-like DNA helicase [Ensifer adhaerens]|uniref:AAA family ATPase n=1 Tax=Ensifer adhaerens TaxID=106592 RepID=UPI001CBDAFE8|nr:AAA family ATPase [Ensifer adhaerens]MBZ7921741.1 ATP-dependent RecD-like DNA helicase [Ensifer adhaerens]UAX94147.1 ATP-dependent RecD-like DNA helicase [Ensifer adhaerens]UAY01782.1 ATP-dependent RecD-like DNA helicase [Ensifer adhaerens]UAY09165.1 ATP-dependent RecD-like DNA helicase [Ensifer adhaerens]